MNRYSFQVKIGINVPAPSLEDARSAIEDVYGPGEMEGFDMEVTSFDIKESK